ncbi:MAG: beta-ketoacyl-[acyl-carrier-protein] synthase family protein [Gemmataceae bacterium]|nr:beta-ketoacyl-[acyl-carrier-protein] synthase family protein [Gemmataceae bacterium]
MQLTSRRVVITGIGAVTPLGLDAASFWEALRAGRNAVKTLTFRHSNSFVAHFGAPVDGFDARNYLDKKDRKRLPLMSRPFQFAAAASRLALADAGINLEQLDPTRLATVLGAGVIPNEPLEFARGGRSSTIGVGRVDLQRWGAEGMSLVPPMWMLSYIPNMVGCHVSVLNNAQGPSNTIIQTDVAGLLALGEARRYLRRQQADVVLAGAGDTRISVMGLIRQQLMQPLSRRNDAPERACRPFDRDRDGQVLGEGGGIFVVEAEDHARRRGARIYAELAGFGAAFDNSADRSLGRWRIGSPAERRRPYPRRPGHEHGLARAIRIALHQAGICPNDLDHVNAYGCSTIPDDIWEAQGLAEALGPRAVPVFAAKSRFGNLGVAGGPVELAASLLAMTHGELPASVNGEHPDPACPVRVATAVQPITRSHFLKVSFTELGQCAALVCRTME